MLDVDVVIVKLTQKGTMKTFFYYHLHAIPQEFFQIENEPPERVPVKKHPAAGSYITTMSESRRE